MTPHSSRAGVSSVLFAVQLNDLREHELLARRLSRLADFYAPLAPPVVKTLHRPELRLVAGQVHLQEPATEAESPLVWGGPLPRELRTSAALLDADDARLRSLESLTAAGAADDSLGVLVGGCAGIATLYQARGDLGTAYATHAVAAAWLACGSVTLDTEAVPELLARDFVGGDRTLVAEARALPTATKVTFTPQGGAVGTYWPAEERWASLPEATAHRAAERELVESLGRRVNGAAAPFVSLTAGLDSRTVAVALRQAGVQFRTFTWGGHDWDDVLGARRVAEALGVEHRRQDFELRDDATALRLADAEARWTEGAAGVRFMAETYPAEVSAVVNGMGGEIGRAFYYGAAAARASPKPSLDEVAEQFRSGRVAGFLPDRVASLRAREREWLEEAHCLGVRGWRCLDVVYAEQRVRQWGRAMLPFLGGTVSPGFVMPRIARALVSLPLEARVSDAFPRRFLASRAPSLAPAAGPQLRSASLVARIAGRRLRARLRRLATGPGLWFAYEGWSERPRFQAWVADEALSSPLLRDAMGGAWCARTRNGLRAGRPRETRQALLAAGPFALEQACRDLRGS